MLLLLQEGRSSEASARALLLSHRHFAHTHGFCVFSHRELHALVKSQHCLKGPSHEHLQGGISFGIGAFNLVGRQLIFIFADDLFIYFLPSVVSHGCHAADRLLFISRRSPCFLQGSSKSWNLPDSQETRCGAWLFSTQGGRRGRLMARRLTGSGCDVYLMNCLARHALPVLGVRSVPPT